MSTILTLMVKTRRSRWHGASSPARASPSPGAGERVSSLLTMVQQRAFVTRLTSARFLVQYGQTRR